MKRFTAAFLIAFAISALGVTAQADPNEYAIESASATASTVQAGAHPDFTLTVRLKKDPQGKLPSRTQDFFFDLPPGLIGNINAIPTCSAAQLVGTDVNDPSNQTGCPQASQVGIVQVELVDAIDQPILPIFEPIYNVEPRYGEPARFGFMAQVFPVLIDTRLRSEGDYGVTAMVEGNSSLVSVLSANNTLWGVPADKSHDSQRITPYEAIYKNGSPDTPNGKRSANLAPVPFMLNGSRCGVAQGVGITAIPYALPTLEAKAFAPMTPNSGCGLLDFKPEMSVNPTTSQAETGSGLNVELSFPTEGLEHPNLLAEAGLRRAEVILPKGMTINPSQAVGLGVCSKADFARESASSAPNEGCPETSKIGSATAKSPLIDEPIEGSLYIAKPYENPFGTLIAAYFVFKVPGRGVIVKLPARVEPDPKTGQLKTIVDDIPQAAVASSFKLHFREGARSPLVTPPTCGVHESTANLSSWADPSHPISLHPSFEISSGVNGGPCPVGTPPFNPGFTAGSASDTAGAFSPDYVRFTRNDGDQDLTRFSAILPPGLTAKLAGVSRCPDAAIEAARSRTGIAELASPSCPKNSEIGHVLGGAGVGSVLTYATGKAYLAGPYHGASLSVVGIVPAVAGPFDVGTIVTRLALTVDPDTGQGQVDGSRSDPLPHILAGIPLKVRDIRAYVDRPEFTLNPTGCEPEVFQAKLWGGGLDPFSSADDSPVSRTAPFQVANCSLLGFKPKLSLKLSGGTVRGAHPALRAVLRPRPGDANIASAQVTLPRSAFIEQAHFRTICTRVQFAAHQCPAGSVYGHVRVLTPLLDEPVEGPVYLRSSSHQLPDLVFAVHGIVDLNVVGRVDSVKGRLRSTFESTPDLPSSKVVLTMQGGKKGLFVNSANLCADVHRAKADFTGHNGKVYNFASVVQVDCGGKAKKGKGRR